MNKKVDDGRDAYRSFLLLSEIGDDEPRSQRELSNSLGLALGLVNSYLKNLIAKGFVRVKAFPRNRYAYLLTPKGIAEKSRLAYQHLTYFNNLYKVARQDFRALFRQMLEGGAREVVFCGVDEVAEIAYLSLREAGLDLLHVVDPQVAGGDFFGRTIEAPEVLRGWHHSPVVITSFKRGALLEADLRALGVKKEVICMVGGQGRSEV